MNRLLEMAIETAAKAHEGQVRKGSGIPYIAHPYAVGMILREAGCSDEVVAAGILHDTTEDTPLTLLEIESRFGKTVASLVAGASEPDKSKRWEERKNHTIAFLRTAPMDVRMIVCADKLHNLRSILADYARHQDNVWQVFSRGKEKQMWYYKSICDSLFANLAPSEIPALFGDYERQVAMFLKL